MKKFLFLMISMVCLISCQEYSPIDITANEIAYNKAFKDYFGSFDENHSWGFIEQPILDYTKVSTTRAVNPNSNEWESVFQLNVPNPITEAEAEWVYNYFANEKLAPSVAIHWSSFFIQYVHSYNEYTNTQERNMDFLGYESIYHEWEHVNNFNTTTHATQYVYDAGTENWTYRSSKDDQYHNDLYNIQYLSFTAKDGKHYEGWYIGFDYESANSAGELDVPYVDADGKFNDWIVKVSPGTHQGYPITVRIMCEDLGGSFDWDFNDVVFDVTFYKSPAQYWPTFIPEKLCATIALRAAGGTLPIYVGTMDENYEAHKLLGDGSMTPLIKPTVAIYTIDVTSPYTEGKNTANARNIPIYVRGTEAVYKIDGSNGVPQKFACPDNVEWADELQNICNKYQNIPSWIQNEEAFESSRDVWIENPKNF